MDNLSVTDRRIYEEELRGFLPRKIFDAHVHLFDGTCLKPGKGFAEKSVYRKFGSEFRIGQYLEWARQSLPEPEIHLNGFGQPSFISDLDASAVYSGRISDNRRFFGMALVSPKDAVEDVIQRVEANRLVGYKPYLNFVDWKAKGEITIHDMLPDAQMAAADERGLAVTLHIPRDRRLADPVNQEQMVELCRGFPGARVIFAHIGRAYYLKNVIGFLDGIAACPNAYVDTAMVNHEGVLEYTFQNFPRGRILFGTDAPIAMLRGKSVEINNQYAYLMGEDYAIGSTIYDAGHAVRFTSFYYEQLRGIKVAAQRAGLSRDEVENIFFNNADQLFRGIAGKNYGDK
ncbi:MAG: amidohydrolase family protein [Kiritimatiellae bacterium]|nr:amidohydrolase family protein [Kiritimatiellia bacterium]MDD4026496.1 amidohydrolase family protein [Kiritimatiellia bacterium]